MIPFNYHHLYYFYTIAKTGSVSLAAKRLRLAQPTLSAQLKQFESFLEKKLFEREGRRLVLTNEGHQVLGYAEAIFDLGKELMDRQGDFSKKGRIRFQIGVDSLISKTIVYMLIQHLFKVSPEVFIVVDENRTDDLIRALKDHQLDLILSDQLPLRQHEEELDYQLLAKIPIFFCAHPKFKAIARGFPKSLGKAPVILPTASSASAQAVKNFFLEHGIEPHIAGEIRDVEIVRRLVLDGAGIAPLNLLTIQKAPASKKLLVLKSGKEAILEEKIYAISKKRKNPHALLEQVRGFASALEPVTRK